MDRSYINVEAFAGAKGEETPRAFSHEGSQLTVTEIVTRWYTETHCYFRLQADEGSILAYVASHDLENLIWEVGRGPETTEQVMAPDGRTACQQGEARRSGPLFGLNAAVID
jgi:hypothetical protein